MFNIVGGIGGFPVSSPLNNFDYFNSKGKYMGYSGLYFKSKYSELLNAYAASIMPSSRDSEWTDEFKMFSQNRMSNLFATGDNEVEFRLYEVLMMESLTRMLVDTFYGGDIGKFNTFNYQVAHITDINDPNNIISTPIYNPDHNNADFVGLEWISDLLQDDSRLYIGPRVVD